MLDNNCPLLGYQRCIFTFMESNNYIMSVLSFSLSGFVSCLLQRDGKDKCRSVTGQILEKCVKFSQT
jgi:hypothetical protein